MNSNRLNSFLLFLFLLLQRWYESSMPVILSTHRTVQDHSLQLLPHPLAYNQHLQLTPYHEALVLCGLHFECWLFLFTDDFHCANNSHHTNNSSLPYLYCEPFISCSYVFNANFYTVNFLHRQLSSVLYQQLFRIIPCSYFLSLLAYNQHLTVRPLFYTVAFSILTLYTEIFHPLFPVLIL